MTSTPSTRRQHNRGVGSRRLICAQARRCAALGTTRTVATYFSICRCRSLYVSLFGCPAVANPGGCAAALAAARSEPNRAYQRQGERARSPGAGFGREVALRGGHACCKNKDGRVRVARCSVPAPLDRASIRGTAGSRERRRRGRGVVSCRRRGSERATAGRPRCRQTCAPPDKANRRTGDGWESVHESNFAVL